MISPKQHALAALVLLASVLGTLAASPSPSTPTPSPVVNCEMTAFACSSKCSATCGGGTCDATRSVQTAARGGGTACGATMTSGYACAKDDCAASPPPPPPDMTPVVPGLNVTVSATLSLVSEAWPSTETSDDFVTSVTTSVATTAGVAEKYVTVNAPVRVTGASRRLLQDTVTTEIIVVFQTGDTDSTKNAAVDASNAFVTKAMYMTDWVLPTTRRDSENAGTATVAASVDASISCPADTTYDAALALALDASYVAANRGLNDMAHCLFADGDEIALNTTATADVFNMLGFTTRKLENPDTDTAESYYKSALQIDNSHVGATGYLGELYVQTNQASLARESLDKLKTLCPPPNDCDALGVLRYAMSESGMIEGAFVRNVDWNDCFAEVCSPMNITVGDSLSFTYSNAHDVVLVEGAAAFDTCASGTTVASTSNGAGYERKFETVGVEYLVCSQSTHCANGQKLVVNVHTARYEPSVTGAAPSYSLEPEVEASAGASYFTRKTLVAALLTVSAVCA